MSKIISNFAKGILVAALLLLTTFITLYLSGAFINVSARVFHGTNKIVKSFFINQNNDDIASNIAADADSAVANVDAEAIEATKSANAVDINSLSPEEFQQRFEDFKEKNESK